MRLRTPQDVDTPISASDPAIRLVTDFTRQQPATVLEHVPIDVALDHMKTSGVRALLVLRDEVVVGLITSYDIQSTRVARFQHGANISRREDVEVGDIMSPWEQVPVLDWQFIQRAKVRDIANTFARFTGSHVVVVEHPGPGQTFVRGVISRSRLAAARP